MNIMISDYQTPERMAQKLQAVPLPDLHEKTLLDVGCDGRAWCELATSLGASRVVGIDRGRLQHDGSWLDLADHTMDLGRQYHDLGQFDVVLCLSMYHHAYQSAGGDHRPIWYWLWRQTKPGGMVLWEGPLENSDPVVKKDVASEYHQHYNESALLIAAARRFWVQFIGPALHTETRSVYRMSQSKLPVKLINGQTQTGTGGATKAFDYDHGRRVDEIETILGIRCLPGSLNVQCNADFWWDEDYYRAEVSDVIDRRAGLDSEWGPRWARFYPVTVNGLQAWAFRFEGEKYSNRFVELISCHRLRDSIDGAVTIVGG